MTRFIATLIAGAALAGALAAPALAQSSDSSSASSTPGGEGSYAVGAGHLPTTGTAFNDGTRDATR
jgi:hypothetical protein